MARIALGALTTLNLSTHLDPMFTELYGIADYFTSPSYTGASSIATLSATAVTLGNNIWLAMAGAAGQVLGSAGSGATSPAFAINGDADTGLFSSGANVLALATGGLERWRTDSNGNLVMTNAAGLGYGAGSGGTVTQATSKSTGVTLNKPSGQITMNGAALAAGASVEFVLTNSVVAATDVVLCSVGSGFTTYRCEVRNVASGSVAFRLTNVSGGSLSEAVLVNFTIVRGSAS